MNKKYSEIIKKASLLNERNKKLQKSREYLKTIGLLSGLGFLIAPGVKAMPTSKVYVEDAIRIGSEIEPRILEILPAAILSFPKSFMHLEKAPDEFLEVIKAVKKSEPGPDYGGIPFKKYMEAALRPIKNRKCKTITEKRISKTFRFKPQTIKNLTLKAKANDMTVTAYIEQLIS